MECATVRQKKTGRPVRFEITGQSRQSVDEYLGLTKKKPGSFMFARPEILGPSSFCLAIRKYKAPSVTLALRPALVAKTRFGRAM
jgi:hypothetical protein